jgi:RNA polymerase sigma-70 factor, ECF subfamily
MSAVPRFLRSSSSDADLVAAVARGDLDALGGLFERYEPHVRRHLGRLGVPPSDADDVVQVTFLEAARAAPQFDADRAPVELSARSWLLGIATMITRRRSRSVARCLSLLARWASLSTSAEPETPAEALEADEAARRFRRAFEGLSAKKREVFALVALEGLSGEEAAKALGVPLNTVWTRLHHARLELRAALEEAEER